MSDLDDLVQRCRQGELAAFTALFRHCEARVYRLAVAILRDEPDAEDAVQDTFLRVFERIKDYHGEAAFQTWLTAITVNLCRDRLRRRRVRSALPLPRRPSPAQAEELLDEIADRERRQTLWALVDRLDDDHRLPVILHYHENLPCDQVARILGLRTSTVYSRLNAARIRLRAMLQEASTREREVGPTLCESG